MAHAPAPSASRSLGRPSSRTRPRAAAASTRTGSNQPKPRVGRRQTAQSVPRGCQSRRRSSAVMVVREAMAHAALPIAARARSAPETRARIASRLNRKVEQRRGLVAGQAEVLPALGRQVGELPFGRRLAQPAAGLVRALVGLVGVEPVVGRGEADGALADRQQVRPLFLRAADAVPAAVQEEDATPGVEARWPSVRHRRRTGRTMRKLDRFSRSISVMTKSAERRGRRPRLVIARRRVTAERAFHGGERHVGIAVRGRSWSAPRRRSACRPDRRPAPASRGSGVEVPKSSTMQSRLDDAGMFLRVHGAQARARPSGSWWI